VDAVLDGDEQVVSTVTDNGDCCRVDTVRFTWDADSDPEPRTGTCSQTTTAPGR
jgi:hypothetical protein